MQPHWRILSIAAVGALIALIIYVLATISHTDFERPASAPAVGIKREYNPIESPVPEAPPPLTSEQMSRDAGNLAGMATRSAPARYRAASFDRKMLLHRRDPAFATIVRCSVDLPDDTRFIVTSDADWKLVDGSHARSATRGGAAEFATVEAAGQVSIKFDGLTALNASWTGGQDGSVTACELDARLSEHDPHAIDGRIAWLDGTPAANVRVDGCDDRDYSDAQGRFHLDPSGREHCELELQLFVINGAVRGRPVDVEVEEEGSTIIEVRFVPFAVTVDAPATPRFFVLQPDVVACNGDGSGPELLVSANGVSPAELEATSLAAAILDPSTVLEFRPVDAATSPSTCPY